MNNTNLAWDDIKTEALQILQSKQLPSDTASLYNKRLKFELNEIDKQGTTIYWQNLVKDNKKFTKNKNKLVLPWVLGMVEEDPLLDPEGIICTAKYSEIKKYQAQYGKLPLGIIKDSDMPDIDIDCLPQARDSIKKHAVAQYGAADDGYGSVCSVGTWTTYKFKSAIVDVAFAIGNSNQSYPACSKSDVYELTTKLPDEVDELKNGGLSPCKGKVNDKECKFVHSEAKCPKCGSTETDGPTIAHLLAEFDSLAAFNAKYPHIIGLAIRIVGCIKSMGMHAGALIIADRPLYGNIPLAKNAKHGFWVSMWPEGRSTQLSKFGYVKWDILGLKTLNYIYNCCELIQENRGIYFGDMKALEQMATKYDIKKLVAMDGWDDIDPHQNKAGHYFKDGKKHYIELNDAAVLQMANDAKTDTIFQFDTDLAKSILSNGVKNFNDLLLLNAMGHPGPIASIPEAIANREENLTKGDSATWRKKLHDIHEELLQILSDTYGVIVWQEQLATIWQRLGCFSSTEAQEARKAVAKKWGEKLKGIEEKWLSGAGKIIGDKDAKELWGSMVSFGRYAFNRSHGVAYCLVAFRCLWLKAHFPAEWWASVMSDCHPDKLIRYMGVARSEGVQFDTLNVNHLTTNFTVTGDKINQGLVSVKGIGEKACKTYTEFKSTCTSIDGFVDDYGASKTVMERLIKLGAFNKFHPNAKATWIYYQYLYGVGTEATKLKNQINQALLDTMGWTEQTVADEVQRQIHEYKKQYPKRNKIPPKILNWKPTIKKYLESKSSEKVTIQDIESLYAGDEYTLAEILSFEKEYLGYYLNSPMDLYNIEDGLSIDEAKKVASQRQADDHSDTSVCISAIVTSFNECTAKTGSKFGRVIISDGVQSALLLIWEKYLYKQPANNFKGGTTAHTEDNKIKRNWDLLKPNSGIKVYVEYDYKRGSFTMANGEPILRLKPKHATQ